MDAHFQYDVSHGSNMSSSNVEVIDLVNDTILLQDNDTFAIVKPSMSLYITRIVVQRYLVPIVVLSGMTGNMFNIIVLLNPKMRSSTNTYLMALAICDSLYLLFTLTLSFLHCSDTALHVAALRFIPFGRVLSDLFGNTAVWLTVCFTLERYIAVRFPMKGKAWCTVNKAKLASVVIFIACLLNTFPEFFEMKIVPIFTNGATGENKFACRYTEFSQQPSYQLGYYWWFVALFTFTPLILLSVFNSLLINLVWKANKKRQLLSQTRVTGEPDKRHKEQTRVTMMLISVVLIFLVCQTPQAVLLIYRSYVETANIAYSEDIMKILGNICNLLVQVNASVNFFLYSYFSSKFRRTFKQVICRCKTIQRENTPSTVYLRSNFRPRTTSITSTASSRSRKINLTIDKNSIHVYFQVR